MKNNRRLISILSDKNKASSFDTVYEWESIISKETGLRIRKRKRISDWLFRQIEVRLRARDLFQFFVPHRSLFLFFVMEAKTQKSCRLTKNTIPVIIDFWLNKNELTAFYDNYKYCPLVLVTSAEVYEFLWSNNCPLKIEHWPLSLPDSQKITNNTIFSKRWDLTLLGRTDPYFKRMLDKYCTKNPDFEYVLGSKNIDNRYFYSNKGKKVGHAIGRDAYINMLRATKISFYTTPGLDEAKLETKFFNQVTPRFLELIAGGCLVIAHYAKNPDTAFYEIETLCNNIDCYEKFEKQLDEYRLIQEVPIERYKKYLGKHYTSQRIDLLFEILKNNKIKI